MKGNSTPPQQAFRTLIKLALVAACLLWLTPETKAQSAAAERAKFTAASLAAGYSVSSRGPSDKVWQKVVSQTGR